MCIFSRVDQIGFVVVGDLPASGFVKSCLLTYAELLAHLTEGLIVFIIREFLLCFVVTSRK